MIHRASIDDIINALTIVKEFVNYESQLTDYFFSGDKDTYRIAFDNIVFKHSLIGIDDMPKEDRLKYSSKFSNEISKECDRLVEFGKEEMKNLDIVSKFINQGLESKQEFKTRHPECSSTHQLKLL